MFRGKKYCSLMIRGEKKTEKKLKAVESFFFLEKKKKKKLKQTAAASVSRLWPWPKSII